MWIPPIDPGSKTKSLHKLFPKRKGTKKQLHFKDETHVVLETECVVELQETFVLQFLHDLHLLSHVLLVLGSRRQDELGRELPSRLLFLASFHFSELSPEISSVPCTIHFPRPIGRPIDDQIRPGNRFAWDQDEDWNFFATVLIL